MKILNKFFIENLYEQFKIHFSTAFNLKQDDRFEINNKIYFGDENAFLQSTLSCKGPPLYKIGINFQCDGIQDCKFGEDEENCNSTFPIFKCDQDKKIHVKLVCDHINDCSDGSDEENCGMFY